MRFMWGRCLSLSISASLSRANSGLKKLDEQTTRGHQLPMTAGLTTCSHCRRGVLTTVESATRSGGTHWDTSGAQVCALRQQPSL